MTVSEETAVRGTRIRPVDLRTTRQRRSLDERILVRFPALAHAYFAAWQRLPRHSRIRRLGLVRIAGQAAGAANRRDFDLLLLGFDPEIDYQVIGGSWGMIAPDLVGHHYGHAGYREVWRRLLEAFPDLSLHPEELLDLGDRLISTTRMRGHGAGSGAPVDLLIYQLLWFRRGLVVKQEDHRGLDDALEAVRLRD